MNISRKKLAGTLRQVFPFNDLEKEHIDLLIDNAEMVYFSAEKMVYLEGTPASFFYILYQGQLEILKEKHHALFQLNDLSKRFSFGEDALATSQKRRTSARAITDVILIKIGKEILKQVGKENTAFGNNINTMITSYDHLVRKTINLGKDETVCYIGQPHPIIVVLKMIFALLAVFGLSILLIILFNSGLLAYNVLIGGGVVLAVIVLLWIGWQFLEWSNDLFFFTDKRIINKQRSLFSYEMKQETPISAIESVQARRSFLGRGLDFGDLEIRTFTGSMRLPFVPEITSVQHILTYLTERRKDLREEEEKQAFETDIRERITQSATARETGYENHPDQSSPQIPSPDSALKGSGVPVAPEDIVYRTHWTILFSKVFIPALLLMSHILLYLFLAANQVVIIRNTAFNTILLVNSIVLLSWGSYRFADWRNNVYIITEDQLIDIDRRPFGMEEKRAAPINNIQSIRYTRNGIFGLLFNFGTVYTRIGDEEFTFDNVHQPAKVQEALFAAKERFQQMEEDAEKRAQRKKAIDWIDSYHQIINKKHGDDLKKSSADDK
jgi:uncharacterized membrane protein YdbT with pleckstrin-like domain